MRLPVLVEFLLDNIDIVVGLEAGHELDLGRDGIRCVPVCRGGLCAPSSLHGIREGGLVIAEVGELGDVEGGHHLMLGRGRSSA